MKRNYTTILLLIAFAALLIGAGFAYQALKERAEPAPSSAVDAAEENEAAADFIMADAQGEELALSDLYGKPVIVNFWATWCGPCKEELPFFDEAYAAYGEEIQFVMLDLSDAYSETPEKALSFVQQNGYHFPLYFDTNGEGAIAYGVYAIPYTLAISADGRVISSHAGVMTREDLQAIIDLLLLNE